MSKLRVLKTQFGVKIINRLRLWLTVSGFVFKSCLVFLFPFQAQVWVES
jgi:hypothetical protein